jgi:hypothetical protein
VDAAIEGWLRFVEGAAGLVPGPPVVWAVLFVGARLLYVGYITVTLRAQERRGALTERWGDRAHPRFARRAWWMMNADGVLLAVAAAKHAGEMERWRPALFVGGWALVAFGIVVTVLTARTLGMSAWLWEDFFSPAAELKPPRGLYRLVDDPKYVLGYSHAYGWALVCFSRTGLLFAAFAHAAILLYNRFVERPHYLALKTRAENGSPTPARVAGEET